MFLWLSLCLILIALLAVPVGRATTGDYFAPATLFVVSWCGTLGLYFLNLLPYQPMTADTVLLVTGTIVAVVLGAIAGQRLATPPVHPPAPATHISADAWITIYSVMGLAGVAWYVALVARILGWDAFATGHLIRIALGAYKIPSAFLFLEYFCIATPLLAFALFLSGVRLRPVTWLGPVACTLATWVTTDRTQFFVLVLGMFFMYVFCRASRLSWRGTASAAVLAAILLGSNFLVVGAWQHKTPSNLSVQVHLPLATRPSDNRGGASTSPSSPSSSSGSSGASPSKTGLVDATLVRLDRLLQSSSTLYLYATGSFAALNVLLEEPMGTTRGLFTIYPVARLLQRVGLIHGPVPPAIPADRPLRLGPRRDIRFNGYTFLYYPLMDFGRIGAIVYAAAVGVLGGWIYGLARTRRNSAVYLLLIAHLSTALVLSVFVNKFNNTASWYILALTVVPFLRWSRWLPSPKPDAAR